MMLIKGGFSHRLHATFPVWQRSFTDHRIRNREDFLTHRLHPPNPVQPASASSEDYPYSSAHRTSRLRRLTHKQSGTAKAVPFRP